jgi:hypothetical protein
MSTTFVIETADAGAGIVIRERSGFRFFAAVRQFAELDGQVFKTVRAAERAAQSLAASAAPTQHI